MDQAKKQGWVVISMKNDWKQVFPLEKVGNTLPAALLGKWVIEGGPQDGARFDFSRDGTLEAHLNINGQGRLLNGKVTVEDKKLLITTRNKETGQDLTRSASIREMTDITFVLEFEEGEVFKFVRPK